MSLKLYEIADRYRDILDNIHVNEDTGEVDITEDTLKQIDILSGEFQLKAESVAAAIFEIETEAKTVKAAAQAQLDVADMKMKKAKWIRGYLHGELGRMQAKPSISGTYFSIYEMNTVSTKLDETRRESVPEEFRRYPDWELKAKEAKEAILADKMVPGVFLEENKTLVIKQKKKQKAESDK